MIIEKIEWLCIDAKEAMVTVFDGKYSCRVFCQPCPYHQGDEVKGNIYSFGEGEVRKIDLESEFKIKKNSRDDGYEIIAEVMDANQRLVQIGKIVIELSLPLPKDINNKDKVVFNPSRLDFY